MRSAFGVLIIAILLSPFAVLLAESPEWRLPTDGLLDVFAFTALQAALSALVSVVAGVPGALGLIAVFGRGETRGRLATAVSVSPNAVPTLLVILAAMNLNAGIRGLWGIVGVHALLNTGLVASSLAASLMERVSGMAELAWIEGASRTRFVWRGVLPLISGEIARLFLFVFAICFASFAVPLVIGGSRATTVEVLIYEKIRLSADWGAALGLAALQSLALLLLSSLVKMAGGPKPLSAAVSPSPLLRWAPGLILAIGPAALVASGLLVRIPSGLAQINQLAGFAAELPELLAGSLAVATLTGVLSIALLLLIALAQPSLAMRRFLLGYAAPSSVLTGFALLILWRGTGVASLVKISLGLTLVSVPAFYRLQWDSWLTALQGQVEIARVLGATDGLIFRRLLLPQLWEPACRLAALGSVWAWGDFALSSVIAERSLTLAMAARGLMGSYRLDAATVLIWIMILGSSVTYVAFIGVGRVLGARTEA